MSLPHKGPRGAPTALGGTTPEALAFVVELWRSDADAVERTLGRAFNLTLGRAIHAAAMQDFPDRRVVLRQGDWILADSTSHPHA